MNDVTNHAGADEAARSSGAGALLRSTQDDSVSLDEVVRVVSRRRWVLVGTIAVSLALAFLWTRLVTPLYSAESLVLIEPKDPSIASLESVARGLMADEATVQSEVWVLSSRSLAERVIRRLELDADPEFNHDLDELAPDERHTKVIDRFMDRLDIQPQENSRVISVNFRAEQPQRAAEIVNALTDEYLLAGLEGKFAATRRAADWLNTRVAELTAEVERAEAGVEQVRRRFGLVSGTGGTLSAQELAELNTQLVIAGAARAEAQARLGRARDLARSGGGVATAAEVLDSPLIQRLREQEAELRRRIAELASELGDRHPRMVQLRAEMADLQAKIDMEVGKIMSNLQNEVSVARAREGAIRASLEASRNRVAVGNENEIELRAAEREAEAGRSLLASLLAQQKEAVARGDLQSQQSDARVIAAAGPPVEPSFPNTPVVLGLVLIASGILGLLAILVLELLDSGFRSGEDVEQATGATSLGFIPKAPLASGESLYNLIRKRPQSAFGEALRTLNWSIALLSPDRPLKSVLITSAQPGEGKTSVATSLALVQAQAGQRVLLIDADTRQPTVNEVTGAPREPGLLDVLSGRATLEQALRPANEIPFAILPAGAPTPNTPTLLASQRMDALLAQVGSRFDLVILDSPPVMAASDSRILARKIDALVLVVRWASTRRETVRLALRQLEGHRALIGVLLTLVDARRHAQYAYGDSGAYTGALEKYYTG